MFKGSTIAGHFSMSKTKWSYLINYGLAPYFKDNLAKEINLSPYFSTSFDESLNMSLQKQQMHIQIKNWCSKSNQVEVRYWDYKLEYGASAEILLRELNSSLASLNKSKMIQLGMDGPNVNHSVLI